jgi:agmatine/peptidylarginine deiminase
MKLMEQELIKIALEHKYELIPIPLPKPIFHKGERLPASYINFTLTNKKVLVPTFGDTNDNNAISILKNAFPNRKVFGINCKEIIKQKGALHCLTMHLNKNILNRSVLQ